MSDYGTNHKRLFRLARDHGSLWLIVGFLSLSAAVSIIVLMYALSVAVDAVFIQNTPIALIRPTLFLIAGAIFTRGILLWISGTVVQNIASKIKMKLRMQMLHGIRRLGPAWTGGQSSGELASVAVEGVEKLDAYYSRFLPAAIHMAVVPVVIAIFVLRVDLLSGLILIVTGPLIPVFMSLIGMSAQKQTQKQWSTLQYLSSHFLDAIQGLRTLKLFNRTESRQAEIAGVSDRFRKSTMGVLKIAFLSSFVLELFASIATALVAVEIGIRLIEGHILFQTGFFVLLLAPEYYLPFRMFGAQHHAGMEGTESAGRIFQILDASNNKADDLIASDGIAAMVSASAGEGDGTFKPGEFQISNDDMITAPCYISFQDVTFRYNDNSENVLTKCTFQLNPGLTTALVGRSGSGKTTLSRLLTRQIHPTTGIITVNDVPLQKLGEEHWLNMVAVVNQSTWFFDDTILANLLVARPDATFEQAVEAARAAGAHDFIRRLPDGYHTRTGELASRFSGGERQRISIARALLKNASVLILDEPSSALDPESESLISNSLEMLLKDRTVFIIAHRLSTVSRADHILVLDDGVIIAEGNHRVLRAKCNLYSNMVSAYRYNLS